MLNLSTNSTPTGAALQTTSRNVRISPNTITQAIPSSSTIVDSSKLIRNGALSGTPDLKALREQLNLEPRRRGRRRQTFGGLNRGRIKELIGLQNIKKEVEEKKELLLKPMDSKLNLGGNNNGNNDAKSPLLASLLSKAEALAKAKIKNESDTDDGQTPEQETILYQFDGESSGASKYLDALKEAGLPTDVPVLIDNGDGNYVTLTEDVLMNVLSNNEEFQFQVTEATLEQGDYGEGIVLQDGTIMMTGKSGKTDGPILTVGKKPVTIKGIRETKKRGPRPKYMKLTEKASPKKSAKKESPTTQQPKKTVQEMINEAMLENLKNGAATEAENDPDAVVMFEVTDNNKINKYVVSSKEINALKTLNELEKKKKQNSPGEKTSPLPATMVEGNTNIAEIKLTVPKNSRKSIVSEVLARVHSMENQSKSGTLDELQSGEDVKGEIDSAQLLGINMETDVLNDATQLQNVNLRNPSLDASNILDLGDEPQILDDSEMVVLNGENELIRVKGSEHVNLSENENLLVNNAGQLLRQERMDLSEEPSEDSQLMQIHESSQDGIETGRALNEHEPGTSLSSSRDMPLLELEFVDGSGKKIEGYRVERAVLSDKELSDLTELSNQGKDSDVIGLLNMVCEDADSQEEVIEVLNNVSPIKQSIPKTETLKGCTTSEDQDPAEFNVDEVTQGFTSRTEHLVMEQVQKVETRHLESAQLTLDEEADCRDLSVEQALQAMMADEQNAEVESREFNEEIRPAAEFSQPDPVMQGVADVSANVESSANFEFYDTSGTSTQLHTASNVEPEILSDESTNKVMAELRPVSPVEVGERSESTITSPTKDVPFAVGLLPLKDALVQIQSIPEYQPRKTRSGSTSKVETGEKRHCSVETDEDDGPVVKRRKITEEDEEGISIPNQTLEENVTVPS